VNIRRSHILSFGTTKLVTTAVMSTLLLLSAVAHAEGQASELEDLRRDVRLLRSQVQALRSAMAEAAERDAQKAAAMSRALEALTASAPSDTAARPHDDSGERTARAPAVAAPVAVAPPVAAGPTSSARGGKRGAAAEAARKSAESSNPGVVRGKVSVPGGEPVAYVYVENVFAPAVKDQSFSIKQVGKAFSPSWAVVQRGATISFPNKDNIYHNVFSLSSGNSFDLGLYSGGESKSHTFNEPGEVEIYCNIHPQMAASALVVPNRLFAKVKPDGTFEIPGVPPGKRKIVAWAPGSRMTTSWVDLDAGAAAVVDLKLESKASGHKNKSGQLYGSYE
jgi:plastocyanin